MQYFIPKRVYYEPQSLDYDLGRELIDRFNKMGIEINSTASHNRVTGIPGKTAAQAYRESKKTLVIGVRRDSPFQTCKPSAHYQLPLVTGCSGMCEYCYLSTNMGKKPYIRIYVNIDEILQTAQQLIQARSPEITVFEGSAVSDPIIVERYSKSLEKTIEFFSKEELGRFRFVTKFTDIDSLLALNHNNHSTIRFSINCQSIIKKYEHGTPTLAERLEAAGKILQAGYPLGFLIAPIIFFPGWEEEYESMVKDLAQSINSHRGNVDEKITLELISHRYTKRAKFNIMDIFPESELPMDEDKRKFKYGQFGYGKYVYPSDIMDLFKEKFQVYIEKYLPESETKYFV
ncbi:MAG: spore photoproduct lyase [Gracilibacter sp. BRH_c7a]|nr:MAG: spore photoproduct lyase [Gracilibacter sp. BRH_c7a]